MLHRTLTTGMSLVAALVASIGLSGCGPDDETPSSETTTETSGSGTDVGMSGPGSSAGTSGADRVADEWGRDARGIIPAPEGFKPTVTNGAGIEFDTLMYDFGRIWDTGEVYGQFQFQNTGSSTLRIMTVKPGCGCTTTTLKVFEYAPGEGNIIEVAFRPQGKNQQTKGITVISNARNTPETKLRITAFLTELVKVEPRYGRMPAVTRGERAKASFTFTCPADPDMRITRVEPAGLNKESIDVRLMEAGETRYDLLGEAHIVQEGEHAVEIVVRPDATWGALYGQVDVTCEVTLPETGETVEHVASCNIATSVWGELQADENMMRTPIVPPRGLIDTQIEISSRSGMPFNIIGAHIDAPRPANLEITYEPVQDDHGSSYIVRVRGESGSYMGTISGTAVIQTDVPGEEFLRFRVAGVVRNPVQPK